MSTLGIKNKLFGIVILCLLLMTVIPSSVEAQSNTPQVVMEDGSPALVLPDSLIAFIAESYPGFRVPTKEDRTGDWATYSKTDAVPYACWGDFNGDGLTDVALMLIKNDGWRLVAFNLTASSTYVNHRVIRFAGEEKNWYRNHPPQGFQVYTVKAGEAFKVGDLDSFYSRYEFDSIAFMSLGDPTSGKHSIWNAAPNSRHEKTRLYGIYLDDSFGDLISND